MLLQFTVENFLSFREPTTLSLLGAPHVAHQPSQVIGELNGRPILRCAAIYGANSSGKSNLIKALTWALGLVRHGTRSGQLLSVRPFRLASECRDQPARFEFHLLVEGQHHAYGFAVSRQAIEEEWLARYEGDQEIMLFERGPAAGRPGGSAITLHPWAGLDDKQRGFLDYVVQGTRPNQLFLTEARERNVVHLTRVDEALHTILPILPESQMPALLDLVEQRGDFRDFLLSVLTSASTGIASLSVQSAPLGADENADIDRMLRFDPATARHWQLNSTTKIRRREDADGFESLSLRAHRPSADGASVEFDVAADESDGTKRLLELAPILSPQTAPAVFVVDEIERSLHPVLTRFLLQQFLEAPGHSSQFIFTTHDTNLLDHSLLSPDSIWFTEKSATGATQMYSLAEFKPEQLSQFDQNLEQGYLQGRFGAIPFLGKPSPLTPARSEGSERKS